MTCWLAIETTDDGELVHGASPSLEELQKRVFGLITKSTIESLFSDDERADIGDLVEANRGENHSNHVRDHATIIHSAMVQVAGENRTIAFYKTVQSRCVKVGYTLEEN